LSPISEYLNALLVAVDGRLRCLSTVSAKQGFRNDVLQGGCGRYGEEDGDVGHHAVAGTGGVINSAKYKLAAEST